jgi:hypothetical protein
MEITGKYTFKASQEAVWELLMNPDAIAKAIPGMKEMVPVEGEDESWRMTMKIGVAQVSGTYSGSINMSEITPQDSYRLTVKGEGQQSIINGTSLMELEYDITENQTLVRWTAEADVAGKLAGVGQRLIKSAAGLVARQFFSALAKQLVTEGN